jgi:hypothetical protein
MVLCFKCSPETKKWLDYFLQEGTFDDYGAIIEAAVMNFAVLHDEVDSKGSIIVGTDKVHESPTLIHPVTETNRVQQPAKQTAVARSDVAVPTAFKLPGVRLEMPQLAPLPSDVFFVGQSVPVDRWIFGQHSKLLPAKASCRALACIYPPPSNGFEIEKVAGRISQDAEALGEYLADHDQRLQRNRDDLWAVGFPSGVNKADRSRLRYANQFVGAIGKQGTLTGLLIDLKLINIAQNASKRILLTPPGWEFALLENPLLDGVPSNGKFAPSEVSFLIKHIQEHVPVEDFAFRTILNAIQAGHDTPEKLDEICRQHVPQKRRDEITKAFVSTQRTGVVSRMIDLGLIVRIRDGIRASYAITDLGKQYVGQPAGAAA